MSEEGDVLTEGDEEVQYVMVVLPSQEAALVTAGMELVLEGLDTDMPSLKDSRGDIVLQGVYEDTLGSLLVMADKDTSGSGPDHGGSLQYLCHTTKQLRMFSPPVAHQAPAEARPDAAGEAGAAAAAAAAAAPPEASLPAGGSVA